MKDFGELLKHLAIAFGIALAIYIVSYYLIEHRRYVKGPWEVTFETVSNNVPALTISQPTLNIAKVQVLFPGEALPTTNMPSQMTFVQPRQWPFPVPFGHIEFEDLTFLPGTVSFSLYGHEVELIPRVIIVDRHQYPWQSGQTFVLSTTNKPVPRVEPKKKRY